MGKLLTKKRREGNINLVQDQVLSTSFVFLKESH